MPPLAHAVRALLVLTLVCLSLPAAAPAARHRPHAAPVRHRAPKPAPRRARRPAMPPAAKLLTRARPQTAAPTAAPTPVATTAPTTAPTTSSRYQPLDGRAFSAPDSVWNKALAPDAPIASYSDSYVSSLRQQVAQFGSWINTDQYSVPVYTVAAGQPQVRVGLDGNDDPSLAAAFSSVPLPDDARPAAGTDGHLVVWQPSTQTEWEFWRLSKDDSGRWHASWGAKVGSVDTNPGWLPAPYGATATSLPLPDGLMTIQEQANGVIPHALALAVPQTIAGVFLAPAQRDDGNTASWSAIPEGMRFRLPASLDIDALRLPRETALIAKAVQTYGMIVRDTAGAVTLYGEDPYLYAQTYGIDPYGPYLFQNRYPNELLASFPWQLLQVVQP
jgi:hypothetical protein